jgi:hypothetical protein
MPLVSKVISVAAGATSKQILQGTTYEYVGPNTRLIVAAACPHGTNDTAPSSDEQNGNVTLNFQVNNTTYSNNEAVQDMETGEPFGWKGRYVMNDMVTTGQVRNRPIITLTNNTAGSLVLKVSVFIGG